MNLYEPQPKFAPKRLPRQQPIKVVPSYIGEKGLVGNWLFYNGVGDKLYDFSGYGNHGAIHGAEWVDGSWGWALSFDGVDDYVACGDVSPDDYITVMAWTELDDLESADDINDLVCHDNGGATGFGLKYHVTDRYGHLEEMEFAIGDGGSLYNIFVSAPNITGEWHHWTLTYDKDTGDLKAYMDGVMKNSSNIGISTGFAGTTTKIGRRADDTRRYWDGSVGPTRIYGRALSSSEIQDKYNAEKAVFK